MTTERTIKVDGRELTFSPFTLQQLREVGPLLKKMATMTPLDGEWADTVTAVLLVSLKKKHADLTADELGTLINMENFTEAFGTAMAASGLSTKGEAKAAPMIENLTTRTPLGTQPLPDSATQPDGGGLKSAS